MPALRRDPRRDAQRRAVARQAGGQGDDADGRRRLDRAGRASPGGHQGGPRGDEAAGEARVGARAAQVVGGGHDWPGSNGNMDIQSSIEIWNFFSQFVFTLGDVNNDNTIDILDVVQLVTMTLDGEFGPSGDLNGDDAINVQDIIILVNIILGRN